MKNFGVEKFKRLMLAGSCAVVVKVLLGVSDFVILGHFCGEEALAALNLIEPMMETVTFLAGLCGVGMGICYAAETGRCNKRRAHEFFSQAFLTVVGCGLLVCGALWLLREPFLAFMAPGASIVSHARSYLAWYTPVALLEPLVVLLVNAALADGDSRLCFISYLALLAVNVVVSLATIGLLGAGGCALGTVAANVCALAVLCGHFLRGSNSFRLVRHFDWRDTLRIWRTSFGDASSFFFLAMLIFFLNKLVIARFGGGMLPVLGAVAVTLSFHELFNGVGNGLAPIVTVYAGELNTKAIRLMMRVALRWVLAEGVIVSVVLAAFPRLVVLMLGIDDPGLSVAAERAVRLVALGMVFHSVVDLFNSYYMFIERAGMALLVTALDGFVVPMALAAAAVNMGLDALWMALAAAPALTVAVFFLFLVLRHGWRAVPWLLPAGRDENIVMFDLAVEEREIVDTSRRVQETLAARGYPSAKAMRAALMTEEVLMTVRDRNQGRALLAEVTLDMNHDAGGDAKTFVLTLRDDGDIFDITDTDQDVSSLRAFLVASVMERQPMRVNLVTTGFNRNVFRI